MNLQELLEWHDHNAAECRHEGEEAERTFHLQAVELLKQITLEEEETAWHCQVLTKSLEGWTAEEVENLTSSLDVAVQTTCDQVTAEIDKDFSY